MTDEKMKLFHFQVGGAPPPNMPPERQEVCKAIGVYWASVLEEAQRRWPGERVQNVVQLATMAGSLCRQHDAEGTLAEIKGFFPSIRIFLAVYDIPSAAEKKAGRVVVNCNVDVGQMPVITKDNCDA